MSNWYVVNTQPNQELRAEANLLKQDYRAWLPFFKKERRHARRVDIVKAPLFLGYIFVELDLEQETWGKINNSFGVKKILAAGENPQALPSDFIEDLRLHMDQKEGDIEINDPVPEVGSTVRVTEGPFAEYMAVVTQLVAKDRVKVLLDILGGKVAASLSTKAISNIA